MSEEKGRREKKRRRGSQEDTSGGEGMGGDPGHRLVTRTEVTSLEKGGGRRRGIHDPSLLDGHSIRRGCQLMLPSYVSIRPQK